MADKGRFDGLVVNFQSLPPKASDPPLWPWAKLMGVGLAVAGVMYLLSLLV